MNIQILKDKIFINIKHLLSISLILALMILLNACAIDANIVEYSLNPSKKYTTPPVVPIINRTQLDFINAETVTTANGDILRGGFGEIAEKQTLLGGAVIEGVFYE